MAPQSRIRKLPALLVNKIAAGEVIERPASVVKELVENAIDAGRVTPLPAPLSITVTTQGGGQDLIRVADNGCGMSPEDLKLAVEPHATSKIADEDDLFRIATMGFRGEALASIGSVSHLRIVSRPHDSDAGYEIRVSGREFQSAQVAGSAPGTTVEVRDLFFNVPARRKFLKTASTESGHINEQIIRAALACPGVGFRVVSNTRTTHDLPPAASRVDRIAKFFSPEMAAELLSIEREERGTRIEAYLAPPAHSRANANAQYLFLNGRYIRDRFVQHAVREAYRGLVEHNRQPVVFIFLTVPPDEVDVNVHPTKVEVRWAQSNLIHSQVLAAMRDTLRRADLTPGLKVGGRTVDPEEQDRARRAFVDALKGAEPQIGGPVETHATLRPGRDYNPIAPGGPGAGPTRDAPARSLRMPAEAVWRSLYEAPRGGGTAAPPPDESGFRRPSPGGGAFPGRGLDRGLHASPDDHGGFGDAAGPAVPLTGAEGLVEASARRPAIQLHNTYLVVETDDGLLIIDQHALHERIMFDQLSRRILDGPLESQRLLLPETLPASAADMALVETHADLLAELGIEAAPIGDDALAVHAFPSILKRVSASAFLRDLLDSLAGQDGDQPREAVIHAVLDMMACKAAVKAGDRLTPDEIEALVAHKSLVEKSSNCPHGRPTTLRLTRADLERQFKRT